MMFHQKIITISSTSLSLLLLLFGSDWRVFAQNLTTTTTISNENFTNGNQTIDQIFGVGSSRDGGQVSHGGGHDTFDGARLPKLNEDLNQLVEDDLANWIAPYYIEKNYPYYMAGYDYENRPVWIVEAGRFNFRKLVEAGHETTANFEKYAKQGFSRFAASILERNTPDEPVTDMIFVVDLDEFSFTQLAHVPTVTMLLKIVREHVSWFSKNLHKMVILNTNAFANTLVNLGRPVLGRVMEKVEVFGTQRSKWQPQVLKIIPKKSLPSWYGGSKTFEPVKVFG